jgi:hypothetical protein
MNEHLQALGNKCFWRVICFYLLQRQVGRAQAFLAVWAIRATRRKLLQSGVLAKPEKSSGLPLFGQARSLAQMGNSLRHTSMVCGQSTLARLVL